MWPEEIMITCHIHACDIGDIDIQDSKDNCKNLIYFLNEANTHILDYDCTIILFIKCHDQLIKCKHQFVHLIVVDTFSFISRRHRGYPFSLSIFMDGRVDCRVSTCCEYKHAKGVKLGGKMGHFSLLKVEGATPCYK